MKLYAIETTDKMDLCRINARNIKLYVQLSEAKRSAIRLALSHRDGRVRVNTNINIAFDKPLDGITKVYDKTDGNEENAPALAFVTECKTSD